MHAREQRASALNPLVPAAELKAVAQAAFVRGASSAQVKAEVAALEELRRKTAGLERLKAEKVEARPSRRQLTE